MCKKKEKKNATKNGNKHKKLSTYTCIVRGQ